LLLFWIFDENSLFFGIPSEFCPNGKIFQVNPQKMQSSRPLSEKKTLKVCFEFLKAENYQKIT
jgi:hypothetical protein